MGTRVELLNRIDSERLRQFNLPGSEYDQRNTPNDWVAIAMHYLSEDVRRGGTMPDRAAFEDSLIKAGAVILAALEHTDQMERAGTLR
ncbi:MAG: hypothetical protein EOO77_13865 [Oxalobacteraceae bacterium]|nr:MAG: hypothetical protein EOO77_13865 [Oxalobacteraceae bacterium]